MTYISIGFIILSIILAARYYLLRRAISHAAKQMEAIEQNPESNRQLKSSITDYKLEQLLTKINDIYQARQQERITYQRRETQIRREIENISHDLRTPLTSIIGYVNLIQEEIQSKNQEEYLGIIHKRAKVLQGFIQDFYELSRIEGDDYPLLYDSVHIQNMISEAAVAYYNEFEKEHIKVEIELEEESRFIIADKIQFNRILNNLIQNALKYSNCLFIIRQFKLEGNCVIQFKNDKNKMTEEQLKFIFDRFYTGDLSRSNQNSGLGLTITKLLVEKMKGKVEARLEEDLFIVEISFPLSEPYK